MTPKAKLRAFFIASKDEKAQIAKYEENKALFNEIILNGKEDEMEWALQIKTIHYAAHLSKFNEHKKALTVISEIERDLEKLKGRPKFYKKHTEVTAFMKAVILHRLKKYKESNIIFQRLIGQDASNDMYISWYNSNKKNMIAFVCNRIIMAGLALQLITIIGSFIIPALDHLAIKLAGILIATVAFITSMVWRKRIG